MSVATEIERLQGLKTRLRTKLISMLGISSTASLDDCITAVEGISEKGGVSASLDTATTSYTVPAGYHDGSGKVSITLETKSVTPTTAAQEITPTSGKVLSKVTVAKIPSNYGDVSQVTSAVGDVLSGKTFVDSTGAMKTGTMANNGAVSKTLDATTITYTIPKGYHSGTGTVKIVLETKTVTPTKSAQEITPTTGKVLSKVKVEAIPDKYIDTSDANAVAANILVDKTAYVGGAKVTGTMPNNGAVAATIDGLTVTSYTIPEGYHSGAGSVALTNDIETALAGI